MAVNFFRCYRCLSVDHASTTEHAMKIRQHYVYLLDALDTKYSGLLDELFSAKVCEMLVWWAVLAVCLLLPDQSQQWNLPAPNLVTWWLWGAMIRHWFWLQKSRRSRPKYTSEFENLCPFGPRQGSSGMVDCVKIPPNRWHNCLRNTTDGTWRLCWSNSMYWPRVSAQCSMKSKSYKAGHCFALNIFNGVSLSSEMRWLPYDMVCRAGSYAPVTNLRSDQIIV